MWIVLMTSLSAPYAWGPFAEWDDAASFVEWARANIDPCEIVKLRSPVSEMVEEWRSRTGRNQIEGRK